MSDDIISKALGLPQIPETMEQVETVPETIIVENEEVEEDAIYDIVEAEIVDDNAITSVDHVDMAKVSIIDSEIDKEYIDDVSKAKKNVSKMIVDAHGAFEKLILIATQTENPTAFDSAAKMLKTLVDANKEMANLSEMKREAKTPKNKVGNGPNNTTTNNTLILTTAEILKSLKQ